MTAYKCDFCGRACDSEDMTILMIEHYVNEDDTLYLKFCPECTMKFKHWEKSVRKEMEK